MKPFLKWAGGKRQLLPEIGKYYPREFAAYREPFLGSGAVFFDLCASSRLEGHQAALQDSNPDLVACYEAVRNRPEAVIRALRRLAAQHAARGNDCYYDVRDRRFNPRRTRAFSTAAGRLRYTPALAAMLIYLNRTGFNGLFRLNAHGGFNVPVGRYVNPRICNAVNLRLVSKALNQPRVTLARAPFETLLESARPGDFLYLDPPYAPLSPTASFTAYTAGGFGPARQRELQAVIVALTERGCHVLLSNSTAPLIVELYERSPEARRAGLRCHRVPARRAINANAARRHAVDEFLITNIEPALQ